MARVGNLADLVESCRTHGSDMQSHEFAAACRRLARTIAPDFDAGLNDHLEMLLASCDRLAAALLILPSSWGYRIERSCDGLVSASIELPLGRGPQEPVFSDEEGAALLGAIASSLGVVDGPDVCCGA